MSDRRRRIEALRAKADSTTFPAEAEALRAKADELAAKEPQRPQHAYAYDEASRISDAIWERIRQSAPVSPNVRIHSTADMAAETGFVQVRVTNVNGRSYTIWVE